MWTGKKLKLVHMLCQDFLFLTLFHDVKHAKGIQFVIFENNNVSRPW